MLEIDGHRLTLADVVAVAEEREETRLSLSARQAVEESRAVIEQALARGQAVYGVTTGFGHLASVTIPASERDQLQENLITNHASGVGEELPGHVVRAMLLLRANALARGRSGIRLLVIQRLLDLLNSDCLPIVPSQGSVGASGDLAPLAHLALPLLGMGEAILRGERMPAVDALARLGLLPLRLEAKEGLALINGTQMMSAIGALSAASAELLAETADVVASLTVQALRGIEMAYAAAVVEARPHPDAILVADHMRRLLSESALTTMPGEVRMQDAYSLRCIPQVHGAARQAVRHTAEVLGTEINSATDNPLVFAEDGAVISGGNFHGEPLALALDYLAIGLSEFASISERRTERLVNPQLSGGLPPFLTDRGGTSSGLMIAQYTAAALVSENKVMSHPASVDSIPTSANQEDFVSMGSISALKLRRVLQNVWQVLGIELLAACQAIDFVGPEGLSPAGAAVYRAVRSSIGHYEDGILSGELRLAKDLCASGEVARAARKGIGR